MSNVTVGYTESLNYKCLEDLQQTVSMGSMNPLNLSYCGMESCSPGWRFGPFVRKNYLIHVVTSGRGVYRVGGKKFEISKGQAFMIYPGVETCYKADRDDPWSYMWVGFSGFAAEETVERIGFTRENLVIPMENTEVLRACMDRIIAARQLTHVNELKRMAAFYDFLAAMMEVSKTQSTEKNYSDIIYVKMAKDLIISLYHQKIKISDIADKIGINRSYLTNVFKREMKMSPQAYLIRIRMERASQLLRETDMPIGNIALSVGYSDALSFSKIFKQKYNISPSEYRASAPELTVSTTRGGYSNTNL